jgi:ATP-binding cassette, subfamily B, multidrug efflux pump
MFAFFERQLKPTQAPQRHEPPASLIGFYWHYVRQARHLFLALFAAGFVVALLDTLIPVFIGRVVTLLTSNPPDRLFEKFWPLLVLMAFVLLMVRPAALVTQAPMCQTASAGKATGTWCASRGRSSRTILPGASQPA